MDATIRRPRVRLYYHVFHPSDNVSARHYSDLARGLCERGWDVTACPANRGYPDSSIIYPSQDNWHGISIRRVWRPNFRQSRNIGRLLNAAWMIAAWGMQAFGRRQSRPDVVIIGTDPILSVVTAIAWKMTRPKVIVAHWGFDLYPEAPIADGMMRNRSVLVLLLRQVLRWAYRSCDLIADIGPCMRRLLSEYGSKATVATLTPWALVEPAQPVAADQQVRQELFGNSKLGLLYSGTFGRAHSYEDLLALARALRDCSISFCFAGRGNRADQLRQAVNSSDANIRFAGFAAEADLEKRLGAADIQMVSLRPEWSGVVVPSKFFGSLAAGRPVLFAGSETSSIARWIREYEVGWVLNSDNVAEVAAQLRQMIESPGRLAQLHHHCHHIYQTRFALNRVMDQWDANLRAIALHQGRK